MRAYKKTNSLPSLTSTSCSTITIWVRLISHGLHLRLLFINSFHCHCLLAKPWMIFDCRVVVLVPESLQRRGQPRIFGRVLYSFMSTCIDYGLYCSFSWVHLLFSASILESYDHLFKDSLYCLLLFLCYLWLLQSHNVECKTLIYKVPYLSLKKEYLIFLCYEYPILPLAWWEYWVFADTAWKLNGQGMHNVQWLRNLAIQQTIYPISIFFVFTLRIFAQIGQSLIMLLH